MKIKVLRIIARLNVGGPAQHVALLSEGLPAERFDQLLVYGKLDKGEGDMSGLVRRPGVRSVYVDDISRSIDPLKDLFALFKLTAIMRKERPHIVHTHTAKAGTLGRLAALLAGVPIRVHTYHGHVFHGYFSRLGAFIFLSIERFLAGFTTRIVAISGLQDRPRETVRGHKPRLRHEPIQGT
jgi:hypothetical protein